MNNIIVKIGSSTLLTHRQMIDEHRVAHLANQVENLQLAGYGVVLVVSGAVACGAKNLKSELNNETRQFSAGTGQMNLTAKFYQGFIARKIVLAQMLLTKDIFQSDENKSRILNCLKFYISNDIVPFVNENDVISLNSFGGNDFLATELAILLEAKQMIMLSSMKKSRFGVGGGESKEVASLILKGKNISLQIVDGKRKNILVDSLL